MEFVWHFPMIVLVDANVKGAFEFNIFCLQSHKTNLTWKRLHCSPHSNLLLKAGPVPKSFIYKVLLPYISHLEQ